MKKITLLLLLLTISFVASADTGYKIDFMVRIDSLNSEQDEAWHVHNLKNGDFILTGFSNSSTGDARKIFFMRLDSAGTLLQKTYYNSSVTDTCRADFGYEFHPIDGNQNTFIFAGQTDVNNYRQGLVVKLNNSFSETWSRKLGDSLHHTGLFSIQSVESGNSYIACGYQWHKDSTYNSSNLYLARLSSTGTVSWEKTFDFDGSADIGKSVKVIYTGSTATGFIAVGTAKHNDSATSRFDNDIYLIRTDLNGNTTGSTEYEVVIGDTLGEVAEDLKIINGDEIYIAGSIAIEALVDSNPRFGAYPTSYVVKANIDSTVSWHTQLDGTVTTNPNSLIKYAQSIIPGAYNSVIISGSVDIHTDIYLAELDRDDGSVLWEKVFIEDINSPDSLDLDLSEFTYWLQPTVDANGINDGGFVATGATFSMNSQYNGSDIFLIKGSKASDNPCGDMNSSGVVDVSDLLYLMNYVNNGGPAPTEMVKANVDGLFDTTSTSPSPFLGQMDIDYLLNFMFYSGPAPVCDWWLRE